MPRGKGTPPHVKRVRAKGKTYYYFETGRMKPNGKQIMTRLPDIADKHRFGGAYAAQLAHRTRGMAPDAVTIAQLVDKYQRSREFKALAESTRRTYDIYLGQLVDLCAAAPADQFTDEDVMTLMERMADRPGAANMMLAVIGAMYAWGRSGGRRLVPKNAEPTKGVEGFASTDYEPWPEQLLAEALAGEDAPQAVAKLEAATSSQERKQIRTNIAQIRLIVAVLFFTAQRVGDASRMRWSDIDLGVIHVIQEKTHKELWIPVHPDLSLILGARPNLDGPLIPKQRGGGHYAGSTLRDMLQAWAEVRGHEIVAHGLRKNAVNALLECGCSVGETSSISGQSLQLVEHYAKRRSNRKLAVVAMGKMQAPVFGGESK